MIRTKGEPGTGNIVEAVRHMRTVQAQVKRLLSMSIDEVMTEARDLGAPFEVLMQIREAGRLPVVNFAAGGIATPADAALMMHLGADGVFVGSGNLPVPSSKRRRTMMTMSASRTCRKDSAKR